MIPKTEVPGCWLAHPHAQAFRWNFGFRDYAAWSGGWAAAARAAGVRAGIYQLVAAGRRVSTSLR